jgi:hypothetical protein
VQNQSSFEFDEFSGWMIVNPGVLYCMDELPVPMSYVKVALGSGWEDCMGVAGSAYWYTWGPLPREWMATAGCPTVAGVAVE